MGEPKGNRGGLLWFWYAILSCCGVERADAGEEVSLLPSAAAERKIDEREVQVKGQLDGERLEQPTKAEAEAKAAAAEAAYEEDLIEEGILRDFVPPSVPHVRRKEARLVQGNQIPPAGGSQTRTKGR